MRRSSAELSATIARQQQLRKGGRLRKIHGRRQRVPQPALYGRRQAGHLGAGAQPQRAYRPAAADAPALARQGAGYRAASQADREGDRCRRARRGAEAPAHPSVGHDERTRPDSGAPSGISQQLIPAGSSPPGAGKSRAQAFDMCLPGNTRINYVFMPLSND